MQYSMKVPSPASYSFEIKKYLTTGFSESSMAKETKQKSEGEEEKEDIYDEDEVEKELDDDEISPEEAGFMEGYDRESDEKEEKDEEEEEEKGKEVKRK
mgnify:CR=1 FL=1